MLREPAGQGPLSGLPFAVKDLFDVAGAVTTYGHPDWARTHPPAVATAPIVTALLEAGARLVGKTKMVELAYGLSGENRWHGTPLNPAAPARFPGGSSSGSASAVAGGRADFALGSDTGGSVRIPASYCGLFGFRPSHGAISLAGARALAPSLDTPGWFAADAALLARIGDVLLPDGGGGELGPLLRPSAIWIAAETPVADALGRAVETLGERFGPHGDVLIGHAGIAAISAHFRAVQSQEVWATLGDWVRQVRPSFGPGVAERFAAAEAQDPGIAAAGRAFRRALAGRMRGLLDGGAVLVFPTSPCPAPMLDAGPQTLDLVREASIGVTALSSLCGLPEISLPAARVAGAPVGLSLVAGRGRDRALLVLARAAAEALALAA